jgi:hypothetical protein
MLQANFIEGIIRPEVRTIDNQVFYYYDITSKLSIDTIYVKSTVNYDQLKGLFTKLADLIDIAYEYLLNENDLILMPDHIYMELASYQAYICYLPGYNKDIGNQLATLIEYLMNKVEYNDKRAVLYIYNLYAVCRNEGFSFSNLMSAIREGVDKEVTIKGSKAQCVNDVIESRQDTACKISNDEACPDKDRINMQIPVMMEKITDEKEQYYYPLRTYIYTGACIIGAIMVFLICLNMRILYNSIGNRIDYGKLMALLLILLIVIGYLFKIIWNKNNRLTKIVCKQEYIDPRIVPGNMQDEEGPYDQNNEGQAYIFPGRSSEVTTKEDNKTEATILLNTSCQAFECSLQPINKEAYKEIEIKDFPYIIGKQRENVDYFLDKEVVSRYHVKISKEGNSYYITDLNSTNGTSLNSQPLPCYQRHEITDGDRVAIAGIEYTFHTYQ